MIRGSWRRASALAMATAFAVAACTPAAQQTQQTPSPAAARRGDGGELRLLWWQGPTILNPHLAQGTKDYDAARPVLEPLAAMGPDGKPVARLAAEIPTQANGGVSADQRTVTWKLKSGVKWSDGSDFTADDVVFTYRYMADAATAATTAGTVKNVRAVTKVDATTVRVEFTEPTVNPYSIFTSALGMILQEKQFRDFIGAKAKDAPGNQNPIGTGPYKVREFKPNDVVTYEINEQYRERDKPYFKTVQLKTVADANASARAVFQTGDADYAWNLQVQASVLKQLVDTGGRGELVTADSPNVERLLINRTNPSPALGENRAEPGQPHPFLTDLKVRTALAMATNRQAVADSQYGGNVTGVASCNIVTTPPDVNSPNTRNLDVCKYDLAAANRLLDEAGWVKGADGIRAKGGVRMRILYQTTVNAVRQATQDIIARDWRSLGIEVELKSINAGVFFSTDVANPDTAGKFFADIEMFTNGSSEPDQQVYLSNWISSEIGTRAKQWRGSNYERFSDPEYDKMFEDLTKERDPAKRRELTIKMNDHLVRNVVVIPIIARKFPVAGRSKDLIGVEANPWDGDLWNLADWRKPAGSGTTTTTTTTTTTATTTTTTTTTRPATGTTTR